MADKHEMKDDEEMSEGGRSSGSDSDDDGDTGPSDELLTRLMKLEGDLEANPQSYGKSMQVRAEIAYAPLFPSRFVPYRIAGKVELSRRAEFVAANQRKSLPCSFHLQYPIPLRLNVRISRVSSAAPCAAEGSEDEGAPEGSAHRNFIPFSAPRELLAAMDRR